MTSLDLSNGFVRVARVAGKGRGLIATRYIECGTVILTEPVIAVSAPDEVRLIDERTVLRAYAVAWREDSICFPVGWTMLINHTRRPELHNVTCEHDYDEDVLLIRAIRAIVPGEEILFDYGVSDTDLAQTYGILPDA
ncbi:MAG: SET domain-containing protein-lysine N-methyltransferase [Hyphomicrobiaceae bacterium]